MLNRIQRTLNLETLKASTVSSTTPAAGSESLTEEPTMSKRILAINGMNAITLDFTNDINDPSVHLFGSGMRRLSTLKKEIQEDLIKFANLVGNRDAKDLMVFLTDTKGKYSSNMYFAFKLQALMEVEEYMKRPEVKRKITLMRKTK